MLAFDFHHCKHNSISWNHNEQNRKFVKTSYPNDFDATTWSHGYDVICEQAVRCPYCGSSDAARNIEGEKTE